jgi:hypothetical protein
MPRRVLKGNERSALKEFQRRNVGVPLWEFNYKLFCTDACMLDRVGSVAGTFTAAEHNHTFRNPNHLKGERGLG